MLNAIKITAAAVAWATAIVMSGGLVLLAAIAWQAWRDPFFERAR